MLTRNSSPGRAAWALALGCSIGLCPVIGVSTPLLTAIAIFGRLNLPLLQLANYAVFPLQILSIAPLAAMGEAMWRSGRQLSAVHDVSSAVDFAGTALSRATLAWLTLLPLVTLLILWPVHRLAVRIARSTRDDSGPRRTEDHDRLDDACAAP